MLGRRWNGGTDTFSSQPPRQYGDGFRLALVFGTYCATLVVVDFAWFGRVGISGALFSLSSVSTTIDATRRGLRQTALLSRAATLRRPWWWSSPSFSSRPVEAQSPRWQHQRPIPELDYLRQALLDDYHDPEGAEGGGGPIGLPDWIREENDSQYQSTSAAVEEENTHRRSREFAGTDYYADEQPSSSSNRSSFFFSSLLFWRTGRNSNHDDSNNNLRDDGSIDFASVQEEWASRSEEDPLWWARDQQQQQQPKQQEQPDVFSGFGGSAKPQSQSRTPTKKETMTTTPSSRSKHHNGITNPQEAPSPRLQVPEYVNARTADADKASAESVVSEI
ncbi:hypothetical protein ACA910_002942 [Epithemia clementina (nom. ined.)]